MDDAEGDLDEFICENKCKSGYNLNMKMEQKQHNHHIKQHHNDGETGSCTCQTSNRAVHQTLDEMEFERGIWTAGEKITLIQGLL